MRKKYIILIVIFLVLTGLFMKHFSERVKLEFNKTKMVDRIYSLRETDTIVPVPKPSDTLYTNRLEYKFNKYQLITFN